MHETGGVDVVAGPGEVRDTGAAGGFMSMVGTRQSGGKFVTIFGDPGVGKTSVAQACFPKPFFIPIEDGLLSVPDAMSMGVPKSVTETFDQLKRICRAVSENDFPFRTVVIDSITRFEALAREHVCQVAGVENLEEVGSYALGRKLAAEQMLRLRNGCRYLNEIGVNVVAIAHSTTINEKPADMDDYTIWTLDIDTRSRGDWIANADAVIHVRIPTTTTEQGKRHVARLSGDYMTRTLGVTSGPSTIAKNRFRCVQDLEFVMNPDGSFTNPLETAFGSLA